MASATVILLWLVTATACLAALLLWRRTRRLETQIEQLSHRYWELKYEQQELRTQLQPADGSSPASPAPPAPARAGEAFVPLASLRR